METRLAGGQTQLFYGLGSGDLKSAMGKRSAKWDLNDWKWDEDLFLATPLLNSANNPLMNYQSRQFFPLETGVDHAAASSNSSSSNSGELNLGGVEEKDKRTRELDKRRVVVVEDSSLEDEATATTLALKLGRGHCFKPFILPS